MSNNNKIVFEVGVGNPYICRTRLLMGSEVKLHLFEPNITTYKNLVNFYGHYSNVTIHNVALFDRDGEILFSDDGDSSFVSEVMSPTKFNSSDIDESKNKYIVPCRSIKLYDNGDIDLLLVDTEGSEWMILKNLVSRPDEIVLETHNSESGYVNPHLQEINDWMSNNNYVLTRKNESDSFFKKIKV